MPEGRPPKKEEVARVLDYLPYGRAPDFRSYQKQPLVQGVGESNFVLMEMTPKEGLVPAAGTRVYIGSGERDAIDHVNRRIDYSELSNNSKLELPFEIQRIVLESEARFIRFFNEAGPISGYEEFEGNYIPVRTMDELVDKISKLKERETYQKLATKAFETAQKYHISKIIKLYKRLEELG